jgi:hypothetical protein
MGALLTRTRKGGWHLCRKGASHLWLSLLLAVLAACSDLRVKVGVFDTVDEARAAGAVAAGWVPEGLPKGASDLREGHLPDGRHWGVFTFPRTEDSAVRGLLGQEIAAGTLTCDPPGRLEWWPRLVRSPVDVEQVRATGFRVHHGLDGRTYVVNWGQGRAYYWR